MSFNITNAPKAYAKTLTNGSTYAGANLITFAGVAVSLVIDASQTTGAITCRLNGDSNCTFTIRTGQVFGWSNQDIQATSIDFANASGSSQNVQIIAGVITNS